MFFDELDGLLEVIDASSLGTVMSGRDEIFDSSFVFLKKRMDVILV
jgi:hypothetical protein